MPTIPKEALGVYETRNGEALRTTYGVGGDLGDDFPEPYWASSDGEAARFYLGDSGEVLRTLPARRFHTVLTSPPYWGLRDYGTGTWEGGDPACDHQKPPGGGQKGSGLAGPGNRDGYSSDGQFKGTCPKCGARRVDRQIGLEETPDCLGWATKESCGACYVCQMVGVFREVRRVLRDDGTVWLNLGDTYLPDGNLAGIPWKVAFALQADGWILRQEIIWAKPSPMPESVRNRCTKAHEYVFLLTKRSDYFYDGKAIEEDSLDPESYRGRGFRNPDAILSSGDEGYDGHRTRMRDRSGESYSTRNKRSVWWVVSRSFSVAHFATFPTKLIEPMILAGTSERGCCPECEAPWERVVVRRRLRRERPNDYVKRNGEKGTGNSCPNSVAGVDSETIGWRPGCKCYGVPLVPDPPSKPGQRPAKNGKAAETEEEYETRLEAEWEPRMAEWEDRWDDMASRYEALETVPCRVLDPFVGSGTAAVVALEHGRRVLGIDFSQKYLDDFAVSRSNGVLLSRPSTSHLANVPGAPEKEPVVGGRSSRARGSRKAPAGGLPKVLPKVSPESFSR